MADTTSRSDNPDPETTRDRKAVNAPAAALEPTHADLFSTDFDDYTARRERIADLTGQKWAAQEIYGESSPEACALAERIAELSDRSSWPQSWREFYAEHLTDPLSQRELTDIQFDRFNKSMAEHARNRAAGSPRPTFAELRSRRAAAVMTPPTPTARTTPTAPVRPVVQQPPTPTRSATHRR
ncbi:hypothetical protein [Nocardia thailandica]